MSHKLYGHHLLKTTAFMDTANFFYCWVGEYNYRILLHLYCVGSNVRRHEIEYNENYEKRIRHDRNKKNFKFNLFQRKMFSIFFHHPCLTFHESFEKKRRIQDGSKGIRLI